ncbi:MAG: hypothetical protein G3M78_00590 [Candidatus Nitrohelix vancouverensis]|uniref:Uncharacterized protein n=1 Tax=Candidatus Nitrohelix vancouverensis TaxID=2705534 RepID=A0A7T0BZX5_9BACT|nr:MAG: hypothetical protein G3M78_00590 [Candidatus Nitrohelix vancouverensis]
METTASLAQLYSDASSVMPLGQLTILMGVSFFCLIQGRYKLGFLMSYFFIFYWTIIMNRGFWMELFGGHYAGMFFILIVGVSAAMAGVIGLFQQGR